MIRRFLQYFLYVQIKAQADVNSLRLFYIKLAIINWRKK